MVTCCVFGVGIGAEAGPDVQEERFAVVDSLATKTVVSLDGKAEGASAAVFGTSTDSAVAACVGVGADFSFLLATVMVLVVCAALTFGVDFDLGTAFLLDGLAEVFDLLPLEDVPSPSLSWHSLAPSGTWS
jgi:hypothetical protein